MKHKLGDRTSVNNSKAVNDNADLDACRDELSALDLTPPQEQELLQALTYIMAGFVDIGWGVDAINLVFPELFDQNQSDNPNLNAPKPERKSHA